jgi:thioredoxin 1/putative thioredoxin
MTVVAVTEATFEREVLRSEVPVLIDFHADWCQPCKQQTPIVLEVARELEGKLKVATIDVDKSPRIAASFKIQSIPQLFVVADGQVAAQWDRGVANKETILKLVRPFLPAAPNELKPADLAQLLAQKRVVPVDVRDAGAFGRYRIPGAINIPLADLETRVDELVPRDGRIRVLYGRSTDEARDAVEKLVKQGHQLAFLVGGFLHWEADSLPIERGQVN